LLFTLLNLAIYIWFTYLTYLINYKLLLLLLLYIEIKFHSKFSMIYCK
jgi:hypothetical protein